MSKALLYIFLLFNTTLVQASLIPYFNDPEGETDWKKVANFSGTLLTVLLFISVVILLIKHRQSISINRQLRDMHHVLEQRVKERTASIDESNRLLTESNRLLITEINGHKETTQRLQSSEAYIKSILESMPLMLIGLNQDLTVTQWNKLAEKRTGLGRELVISRNLWDAYPTITVSPKQVQEVFDKGLPVTIKHSQRGQYYFDITIYPLQGQTDTGLVILIDDVTQRILAENMLVQRDKMSSMGELAATMAHDIDAPLQAILGDLQVAQAELLKADTSESAFNIVQLRELLLDAADRGKLAAGVITNLLAFSGSHSTEKKPVYIADIMEHTIELATDVISDHSGLKFRDINIEKKYAGDLPQIPCYEAELQQVFLSLFRHACHSLAQAANEDYKPKIKIEMAVHYDALWVKVQHNGLGLTAEEQHAIFEPFFSNSSLKSKYDAGNRLSFSYFIVTDHHQGEMAVTSDVKIGTTFHIQLPLH